MDSVLSWSIIREKIVKASITLLTMILFLAGAMFEREAPGQAELDTVDQGFDSYFAFVYYVIVTLSTVGYGDWSPTLPSSRVLAMMCIGITLTYFPYQLGELVDLLTQPKTLVGRLPQYKDKRPHIVVMGKLDHTQ